VILSEVDAIGRRTDQLQHPGQPGRGADHRSGSLKGEDGRCNSGLRVSPN
jgi:hypothetical protein